MHDWIAEELLQARIARTRALARELSVEALVLFSTPRRLGGGTQASGNVHYLTGWVPMGSPCMMVLAADGGRPVVVTGGPNEARVFIARCAGFADVRQGSGWRSYAGIVADVLETAGISADAPIGLAGADEMPAALHAALARSLSNVLAVDHAVHAMRLRRDRSEVSLHRRAADISDAMIAAAMEWARRPGITPARLMIEVEAEGRRMGADSASLWLATGKAPSTTYFELFELAPSIEHGDRIQLGTTVSYEGHFAQGLRIGVLGRPSNELVDAAAMLIEIQDATFAELVPGQPLHKVVDTLEQLIDRNCPYARDDDPFRFQSCHGLGLNYSEPGMAAALSPATRRPKAAEMVEVVENMVLEIHPNFTVPGLGHICAGDVVAVTKNGPELLTHYPRGVVTLS